jgi:biotin synthase
MNRFEKLSEKVLNGEKLADSELLSILNAEDYEAVIKGASKIRKQFFKDTVHLCSILNTKSGACSEDCKFCAQSIHYNSDIVKYPFVEDEIIYKFIYNNRDNEIHRLSFVSSGKKLLKQEVKKLTKTIEDTDTNKNFCASLGILSEDELKMLKESGIFRYHHNLETSRSFYNNICTTHTYEERINTVKKAKEMGFSVCCGGIFGMGESDNDILELAEVLKELDVDAIPINFLNPIKGTPMQDYKLLTPEKCLKIIAFFRFYFPDKEVIICGGRAENLSCHHEKVFNAGASGIMTGDYLTIKGRRYDEDLEMIKKNGYKVF